MEITTLTDRGFATYPRVFVIPTTITSDVIHRGTTSHFESSDITLPADATIRTAIYSLRSNRCTLNVASHDGAVLQDFKLKFNYCHQEFRGIRTLHVEVVDTPHMEGKKRHYLSLKMSNGVVKTVRKQCTIEETIRRMEDWFRGNMKPLADIHMEAIKDKKAREYLDPGSISGYYDETFRRNIVSNRLCYVLSNAGMHITLDQLIAAGFFSEYPQIEVPIKVLKKYDTRIKYEFMGVIQRGGNGGHIMNLQTAKRIEQRIGEPVSVDSILSQLNSIPSVRFGLMQVWAIGIATKTTKRLA